MERVDRLAIGTAQEVLALADAAAEADGSYPLAEDVVLRLRHPDGTPAGATHLLLRDGGRLAGYAYLAGGTAELVVHPAARRRGFGRALATAVLATSGPIPSEPVIPSEPAAADPEAGDGAETGDGDGDGDGPRFWAHGDHPGAAALARSLGLARTRVLWRLRRPLTTPVREPVLPAGVALRAFRPGLDDQAWLDVNARAFAGHPEQGRWTIDDLRVRLAEPWFDAAGFLLAVSEAGDRLLGFHWTKVHPGPESIGEVYVLGVDPATHGTGLGTALTLAGLRHLRERGLANVMLYVDESNRPAMALYEKLGFTRWTADVMYAAA